MADNNDSCAICHEVEWGLPTLVCCKKSVHHHCLIRCLEDGTRCIHCGHTLLEILLERVHWCFKDYDRKMLSIWIADGGHLLPRNQHAWNFLEPSAGQWGGAMP